MSRIQKIDPAQWDPELREQFRADEATDLELGLMRMFAHRPGIAKGMAAMMGGIAEEWTMSQRLKELVRLRVAFHNQCRSCLAIRYRDAVNEGVDEELVCSLENPPEAPNLTDAEKAAIAYADKFATNHLSIGDADFDELRLYFDDGELVELCTWIAICVGMGRLGAVWDMIEELPETFQDKSAGPATPWSGEPTVVR